MEDRLDKAIEMMQKVFNECCNRNSCKGCQYYDKKECELIHMEGNEILEELNMVIPKEPSIQLKNIDLSGVNFLKQGDKVIEERKEFTDAVADYRFSCDDEEDVEKFKNHAIEEFWDMVQAGVGLLQKVNINADEVMAEYPKHLEKMESRGNKPREKVKHNE